MVRSKRLNPIKTLAKNKEKAAAQALGNSIERQKVEDQKLQQLYQYRHEYLLQMESKVKSGISGSELQRYHLFLAKLDSAIEQQKDVLMVSAKQLDASQSHWQEKRNRTKAISQVMEKMQNQEKFDASKKEAKASDEISTQAFLRSR
ncbi:flagellar export protein FliJ [Aliikangiella marina]|uniref:Flagellar FliJ protein n=1 Tax=Aliikangiella marina TaxID=1712262 RepID=A0A545TDN1_9GAMM|nr:flagellar export protein FliJ [Aliikangiella marina]TQV75334.1 flagellar export protein FliJ [Aliikangiella marina]